jgi:hypothetical protein
MKTLEFLSSDIGGVPQQPGIYAWYYRPRTFGNREAETLGQLITSPSSVRTEITMRYELMWEAASDVNVLHGGKQKRQPANKFISDSIIDGSNLITSFFQNSMVPYFAKPLYIGIDNKNLCRRIKEHYDLLSQLWEPGGGISKYLGEYPDAGVQDVLDQFDLKHSFAINARVKRIAPKDLVVCVCSINLPGKLRELEKILQILVDPICGRS